MDSILAVEKEVDKAIDSFETFYQGVDDDIDRALETVLKNMNEIMRSKLITYSLISLSLNNKIEKKTDENDQALNVTSIAYVQQCKEQIRDLVKKYSDKHKDLHGSISKIGKVIDKVKSECIGCLLK
jgi:hypothetical protein